VDHRYRSQLNDEIHGRPFLPVPLPATVVHLALVHSDDGAAAIAWLGGLCDRLGEPAPPEGARHHQANLSPDAVLKFERHGEFCTWTLVAAGGAASDWRSLCAELPGLRMVAVELTLAHVADGGPEMNLAPAALFGHRDVAGARMNGGRATVWTDFRIQEDGYLKILVHEHDLTRVRLGRLVRRLLEIETYRMMALLALPEARAAGTLLTGLESELSGVIEHMADAGGTDEDKAQLSRLTGLARDIEHLVNKTSFRFAAARAYNALVLKRLNELREDRIEGLQRLSSFLDRRFTPAMDTCAAVSARIDTLSRRIERASNLLRTRVDIALEAQNQALLASMEERSRLQLRLQETVEGLSAVAISYYLIGLLAKLADGAAHAGLPFEPAVAEAVAVPVVLLAVWRGLIRVRRNLTKVHGEGAA